MPRISIKRVKYLLLKWLLFRAVEFSFVAVVWTFFIYTLKDGGIYYSSNGDIIEIFNYIISLEIIYVIFLFYWLVSIFIFFIYDYFFGITQKSSTVINSLTYLLHGGFFLWAYSVLPPTTQGFAAFFQNSDLVTFISVVIFNATIGWFFYIRPKEDVNVEK